MNSNAERCCGNEVASVGNSIVGIAIGVVLLMIGHLGSGYVIATVNDATRADLSLHVSNKSCAGDGQCPGKMACHYGSYDPEPDERRFNSSRVGTTITEPRCVTATYVEHHCGIFEYWNGRASAGVHYIGPCFPYTDRPSYGPINYIKTLMNEDNLYDRIFNTDRNGGETIRTHNLKPVNGPPA
jgi:hypothetical protein